jgi:GGDEF domain-containing protein
MELTMTKTHDQIISELISKRIGGDEFSALAPRMQFRIQQALREAISAGASLTMLEEAKSPLEKSIAQDVAAFERTLTADIDTTKEKDKAYPWGWCYTDRILQKEFRQFCERPK